MLTLLALWIGMSAQAQVLTWQSDPNPPEPICIILTYADGHIEHTGNCSMWGYDDPLIKWPHKDIPLDVPAVQETRTYETGFDSCKAAPECKTWPKDEGVCNIAVCTEDTATETITTCADKTRVLWHDESNPAHWWCHKVQP